MWYYMTSPCTFDDGANWNVWPGNLSHPPYSVDVILDHHLFKTLKDHGQQAMRTIGQCWQKFTHHNGDSGEEWLNICDYRV
jgi:hypothetical protein